MMDEHSMVTSQGVLVSFFDCFLSGSLHKFLMGFDSTKEELATQYSPWKKFSSFYLQLRSEFLFLQAQQFQIVSLCEYLVFQV